MYHFPIIDGDAGNLDISVASLNAGPDVNIQKPVDRDPSHERKEKWNEQDQTAALNGTWVAQVLEEIM